jgi:NADPH:quinone reductase-like Zn-dependent oxidoreductase
VNPLTVIGMVEVSAVPKGKYLIQGAAGSVLGRMLIQYTKTIGVKTISIVRRAEQIQELKDLGGDEVINSSDEDVVQRVRDITSGEGAWAGLDPVAGSFTSTLLKSVRHGGEVRIYGALSGTDVNISVMDLLITQRWLGGFILGNWLGADGEDKKQERLQNAMQLLADGVMTPLSGRVFELENVHDAIVASQKAGRGAKVFLA